MTTELSRRDFLKMCSCGLGALALAPSLRPSLERLQSTEGLQIGRVTANLISIFQRPDSQSEVVSLRRRDDLLNIYYPVEVGKSRNPIWYRVWGGYAYSAYLQVTQARCNAPLTSVSPDGVLAEVSVPYARSMLFDERHGTWTPNYRLYYGSTHWLTGVLTGPDRGPWYQITDFYDRKYYAPAVYLRPIPASELAPISPDLPNAAKYIKVSIEEQTLTAFENNQPVFQTRVSSGLPQQGPVEPGQFPSDTPLGDFHITVKTPSRPMGDKHLTADIDTTALPGVPWVCFFKEEGYSLHGTYWHNNFGYKMSHGCVNMRTEDARWIYRWTLPSVPDSKHQISDWGTRVSIV